MSLYIFFVFVKIVFLDEIPPTTDISDTMYLNIF